MIEIKLTKELTAPEGKLKLIIDQKVDYGQLITIYGKSGAGKTSVLRMIAGLLAPDNGYISIQNSIWLNSKRNISLSPQKRSVGVVFQDYALFPNMTINQNISFALKKGQSTSIVDELIDVMELGSLKYRFPETLSGGQQQRVALARALVQKPKILLLDEPLSALDNEMRVKLQQYIFEAHNQYGLTTFLVSHDISEIMKLSNLVWVLENGKIEKAGPPSILFQSKEISGKFQFIGEVVGIEKNDIVYILSVLINNELVKVVVDEKIAKELTLGDKVTVASKAFNPIIKKL